MADSNDDIEAMLHPLPPPPGINDAPTPNALAPSFGPRQICPAEGVGLVLTPPRELETRRLICGSAVSSLTTRTSSTNTTTENAAVAASAAHTISPCRVASAQRWIWHQIVLRHHRAKTILIIPSRKAVVTPSHRAMILCNGRLRGIAFLQPIQVRCMRRKWMWMLSCSKRMPLQNWRNSCCVRGVTRMRMRSWHHPSCLRPWRSHSSKLHCQH